jgi:transcriptional regulator with XRE-family HTH domain
MSTHKRNEISCMIPKMGQPIEKVLADNLTALFKQQGITSAASAEEKLRVAKSTVDRAWRQRSMTRVDTLAELAAGLKLEAWQLLVPGFNPARPPRLAESGPQQLPLRDYFNADEIIELLALFQQADLRERENILEAARGIANRGDLKWRMA